MCGGRVCVGKVWWEEVGWDEEGRMCVVEGCVWWKGVCREGVVGGG